MAGSYELFLIHPKAEADLSGPHLSKIERGESLHGLDVAAIGEFLLALGPHLRFGAATPIGDQYLYEDEHGCAIEIIASSTHVGLGFGHESSAETVKHALRDHQSDCPRTGSEVRAHPLRSSTPQAD